MSLEQLAVFAIFAFVALFNLIARWLKRRMEASAGGRPSAEPVRPEHEVRDVLVTPRAQKVASPEPAPAVVRRPSRAAPIAPRQRASTPLAGPDDLRRAIVAMAVLGPCRGLQSEGPDAVR